MKIKFFLKESNNLSLKDSACVIINDLRNTQLNIKCSINILVEDGLSLSKASQRCDNLISPNALVLCSFPYGGFKRKHLPYLGQS